MWIYLLPSSLQPTQDNSPCIFLTPWEQSDIRLSVSAFLWHIYVYYVSKAITSTQVALTLLDPVCWYPASYLLPPHSLNTLVIAKLCLEYFCGLAHPPAVVKQQSWPGTESMSVSGSGEEHSSWMETRTSRRCKGLKGKEEKCQLRYVSENVGLNCMHTYFWLAHIYMCCSYSAKTAIFAVTQCNRCFDFVVGLSFDNNFLTFFLDAMHNIHLQE